MVEVSTSILNVNPEESIKTFYDLEVAHTDYFHIDVMDGIFVQNDTESIMEKYAEYLKHITTIPLDVHLMVQNIKEKIDKFLIYNPRTITFQIEATKSKEEVLDLIKYIKENNCKVGIAIKPDTKVEEVYKYLPLVHQILIMTVEPGEGGQKLIEFTIEKIRSVKEFIQDNDIDIDIEVDGGINIENIKILKEAGANIIVAGTCIINSDDYKETIQQLKN